MTEKISQLQKIIKEQTTALTPETLEYQVLSICSLQAINMSRFSLDMQVIRELNDYCLEQLKHPNNSETITQLKLISDILESNLQLEL